MAGRVPGQRACYGVGLNWGVGSGPISRSCLHKVVERPWLPVFHTDPVNEGSLTQLLNYLTAGVLWAFAEVVGCLIVVPT